MKFIDEKIYCISCKKFYPNPLYDETLITKEQRDKYINDEGLIQEIMPDVSTEVRECLVSGLCIECQKEIFSA